MAFNSGEPVADTLTSLHTKNASSVIIFEFYHKTHITVAVVNILLWIKDSMDAVLAAVCWKQSK